MPYISTEADLQDPSAMDAFWQNNVTEKVLFSGAYAMTAKPQGDVKGAIVLINGRVESYLKYQEVIYECAQNGYLVFSLDHQGQGRSPRHTPRPHLGYVQHFDHYGDDIKRLFDEVVSPTYSGEVHVLAHSMGGAIALNYIRRYQPKNLGKVILSAPMLGLKLGPLPLWLARAITGTHNLLGFGQRYFWGHTDYAPPHFDDNKLCRSLLRYQRFRDLYQAKPELQLGGISHGWLNAALREIHSLNTMTLDAPCLILQAERDQVVDNQAQTRFAKRQPDTQLTLVKNAEHEILFETDAIRSEAIKALYAFLEG